MEKPISKLLKHERLRIKVDLRKIGLILLQIVFIVALSRIADFAVEALRLPVPGSILGIVLLFALLKLKVVKLSWIDLGAQWLLAEMLLFFVPSTVGIVNYESLIRSSGLSLAAIIVSSTVAVMLCAGYAAQLLSRNQARGEREG
ncbi:CidA/LrgA family protein [Paenibacillus thailandensis]|uniref:CidA/LrgA family protein n=1 Tax=Paenibacillus thailandensis TaxID=393250 RepID=A0ABW5QWN4_9BACL